MRMLVDVEMDEKNDGSVSFDLDLKVEGLTTESTKTHELERKMLLVLKNKLLAFADELCLDNTG